MTMIRVLNFDSNLLSMALSLLSMVLSRESHFIAKRFNRTSEVAEALVYLLVCAF